jgi:hypothetical protein
VCARDVGDGVLRNLLRFFQSAVVFLQMQKLGLRPALLFSASGVALLLDAMIAAIQQAHKVDFTALDATAFDLAYPAE